MPQSRLDTLTPAERELLYEERAAIREFDGGLTREDAERAALDDVRRMRDTKEAR